MSKIEWTDRTVNPVFAVDRSSGRRGWYCAHVSEGCRFCYAEAMNSWRGNGRPYQPRELAKLDLRLDMDLLRAMARSRRPRKYFWCSMTDLFGEWIPNLWRDFIFAAMALAPRDSIHQVLTKRTDELTGYFADPDRGHKIRAAAYFLGGDIEDPGRQLITNLWLGASVEDQPTAEERIPALLELGVGSVLWASYEPALGPIDFSPWLPGINWDPNAVEFSISRRLGWIVAGGESGPHARPAHPDNFRRVRDACQAAGAPYLFKQWGSAFPCPIENCKRESEHLAGAIVSWPDGTHSIRNTKKLAGRVLDGKIWNQFPEV